MDRITPQDAIRSRSPAMSHWRRGRLILEMLALYGLAPLVIYHYVFVERLPLLQVLIPVFVAFALLLTLDRTFSWRETLLRGFSLGQAAQILLTFAVVGGALAWWASENEPRFLSFPRRVPDLYVKIMALYAIVSAPTQEIVFRVLFFHRYAPALGNLPWLTIPVCAACFAYAHIIFPRWEEAVALSAVAGLIFAYRYWATRSFWAVWFEHTLYGVLIFTIGFGRYFFTGVSNVG